jgi:hypothetical protein
MARTTTAIPPSAPERPAALPPIEQHEREKTESGNAIGGLGVERHEGENGRAGGIERAGARALARPQMQDQQSAEHHPTDAVVELGEGKRIDAFAQIDRHRQDEDQERAVGERQERMEPGGEHKGDHRREAEEQEGHAERHRGAEAARQAIAQGRHIGNERPERRVEILVRNLAPGDPVGVIEDEEKVVQIPRRDGLARKREQQGAEEGEGQHEARHRPSAPGRKGSQSGGARTHGQSLRRLKMRSGMAPIIVITSRQMRRT